MDTQFTLPGMKDMMDQIGDMQKKTYESYQKNMDTLMGGNNPMNMFFSDKAKEHPLASVFSEAVDMMRQAAQGMMDVSRMVMPDGTLNPGDPDAFKKHATELPAKILKKMLDIPPVGITRPHQEKVNAALDKMAVFNHSAMDFLYCTLLPVEEATLFTFREIAKQAESLKSPEDVRKVYDLWIKALEKEYQDLFKTDRYKTVIARIFNSMGEFRGAYRELVLDLIQLAGLPFGREVEELSKDMFAMKKKMKEFETQLKKISEKIDL